MWAGMVVGALIAVPTFWVGASFSEDEQEAHAQNEEKPPVTAELKDKKKIKIISDFTKDMEKTTGLFSIYTNPKKGEYYLELTQDQLNERFILSSQIENGVAASGLMKGVYAGTRIVYFEKKFNKLRLISENTDYTFDKESALSRASHANITDAIISAEDILAKNEENTRFLIKVNKLFISEALTRLKSPKSPKSPKDSFSLGTVNDKKSTVVSLKNFATNLSIRSELAFDNHNISARSSAGITDARFVNITIQHDFITMPDDNFKPRKPDARVGFFAVERINSTEMVKMPWDDMIFRWRLEKKYPNKTLSEPKEPIVYWIENTTPRKYRQTIKKAVEKWNTTFEKAGYKNAIVAKIQPDDANWDAGDIRYNVIRWASSPQPMFGGYGPTHVNPLTGEIIGADIMLEYSFLSTQDRQLELLSSAQMLGGDNFGNQHSCSVYETMHMEYQASSALLKSNGVTEMEREELLTQALYYLVLHETGHTLGLTHNMKASSTVAYQDLQTAASQRPDFIPSVMDYPAVNISMTGEQVGQYFPTKPGVYDQWAIEFGYSEAMEDPDARTALLARSSDPLLVYGNDADDMRSPGKGIDPRVNVHDLSDDSIQYAKDRIQANKKAIANLQENFVVEGESYKELRSAFSRLLYHTFQQGSITSRWIAGIYVERMVAGATNKVAPLTPVSRARQKQAMQLLNDDIFSPEAFKFDASLIQHLAKERRGFNTFLGEDPHPMAAIAKGHKSILKHLLHDSVLLRMVEIEAMGGEYLVDEYFPDLTEMIFSDDLFGTVNTYRKELHMSYLTRLLELINAKNGNAVIQAEALGQVLDLQSQIKKAADKNDKSKAHKLVMLHYIEKKLDIK